ncbi:MAG: Lrp/AsnC family transcriptional regulator [Candidatus Heimdallarchaeum aukensis]|uniref:Lrp/AsnC family transcriptional regulator n=2 Tax=Candidatus Heimdallarchaeum TaxID=3053649 RepID=A0A9Y1BPD1_9ARCH|nr:MAG: Lrp/AsnC family transcriptional regulator [Candidatus Heimdallarchaeum aukensis]UJG42592.1 MAG: Lrp/AsnC family transcriptional regulator [Candidatus Heimdallarchaeum endolithica]
MATAFILINSEIGEEKSVLEQLLGMPNVKEAHVVYGVYDLIAKIESETMDSLKKIVTDNLRVLENVRSTMTMICVEK